MLTLITFLQADKSLLGGIVSTNVCNIASSNANILFLIKLNHKRDLMEVNERLISSRHFNESFCCAAFASPKRKVIYQRYQIM